uniref:F-box domain-containing protein n=1 Tax=Caenorhabditis tropicalis TaxID=1561998 RepID=A0A1I7UTM0_9PELO
MDLLRLPLLPLIEVFKNMDFRELFSISLLSKRAQNILKTMSNSFHFTFDFTNNLIIHTGTFSQGSRPKVTDEVLNYLIKEEVMQFSIYPNCVALREKSPQKQSLLAAHLLDTFPKSTVSVTFYFPTLPASALEFMKMVNQRQLCIKSFSYSIMSQSSEFIPRILDECTEVTDSISINTSFPDDFIYTPPRPFKAREFSVGISANWFNIESFLNCRRIIIKLRSSYRTPQEWNTFLKNWINSDVPLEYLWTLYISDTLFPKVIDGLRHQGIQKEGSDEWIEVTRRDGSDYVIGRNEEDDLYVMTKKEHLEHLQNQE